MFNKVMGGAAMKNTLETKKKTRFYVDRKGGLVKAAWIFMLMSAVFRILGCWGLWNDSFFATTQIALPLASNLLFILFIVLLGDKALWLTALPVLMGVMFFIIKSFTFASWIRTVLCIALYLLVAVLYCGTVFGVIHVKWPLIPLFALPFLYHVFIEDVAKLRDKANPLTFADGLQEMSVLCVMLALLMTALAMKKKKPSLEDANLPKIKAPVVLPPEKAVSIQTKTENTAELSSSSEKTVAAEAETISET